MMICHKVLKINPLDLIIDPRLVPKILSRLSYTVSRADPKEFLKSNIYEKLSELGDLEAVIFHMKPNSDRGIVHTDAEFNSKLPHWPSLNIIVEGQGVMKWFNPDSPGDLKFEPYGKVWYRSWSNDVGEAVDQWSEGKVALVRTDIPHNVWNFNHEDRLVASIRWHRRYSWEETIEWFDKNFSL
jgi:hypothetical protein